jgi:hypothetical protein
MMRRLFTIKCNVFGSKFCVLMEVLSSNLSAGTGEKYEDLIQGSQILKVNLNRVSVE